jgi:Predicted symporter
MTTQLLTYIFVGISFALYIGIALWSKAQTTNDFYVAGKGVHPVANGMALLQIGCQQLHSYLWQVL